jgi:preprotein translocase subunit SecG
MQTVLLVVQLLLAFFLIVIVLIQKSSQDGGGLMGGGGTMGGLFTARGSANLLTRATAVLATAFVLNSLALGYLASRTHHTASVIDQIETPIQTPSGASAPNARPPSDKAAEPAEPAAAKPPEGPAVPVAQ